MNRIIYVAALVFLFGLDVASQNVEAEIQVDNATSVSNTVVNFRVRTKVGTQQFLGVSMYFVYQQANLAPQSTTNNTVVGVNDALLTTTYLWGTALRTTTPFQSITPVIYDGQSYNRRYVYINADETGGANVQTLTTTWVTLFSITFNNLQASFPQGGYGYLQETADFINASLTDEVGANIPIDVTSLSVPLGSGTLPVTFTKYDITCNDKGALLSWSTGSEQNSSRFEIQRSLNGVDWTSIDNVAAAGNSTDQRNYQYLDLYGGTAFYRIRQVDIDGRFVYTAVKRTECQKSQYDVALYPVPARDNLNVVIRSEINTRTEIQILDINGRSLRRVAVQINKGNNNIQLSVGNLPAGQYMLVGSDPSIQINKKFTIIR